MTSAINYSAIVTTFPVAGQDNNSQGFRDNFAATSAGLSVAKTEITALQTNVLLKADLATGSTPVVNDLIGSTLSNGLYKQLNGVFYNAGGLSGTQNININNGPMQRMTATGGNIVINFVNWPASGQYSCVRLMLIGDQQSTRTVQFTTENSGTVKLATGLTSPFSLGTTGKFEVFEAWTVDDGTNVFISKVGQF
jgi:hypothetical protein